MNERFRRRARRNDNIARWVITCGGILVIFSVVFILLLIANVTLPLFQKPSAELYAKFAFPGDVKASEIRALLYTTPNAITTANRMLKNRMRPKFSAMVS